MKAVAASVFSLFFAVDVFGEKPAEMPSYCNDWLKTSNSAYEKSPLVFGEDWNSGKVPQAGSTNYIAKGMTVKGPTKALLNTKDFTGDCFVLAGSMTMNNGAVTWKDLRLQDGAIYSWGSNSSLNGNILVESSIDSPASIRSFFGNGMMTTDINAVFKSDADASLEMRRTTSGPAKVEMPDHYFFVKGSWDDFLGTVRVATNSAIAFQSTSSAGNKTLGGKVVVERGGYWFGLMGFGYPSSVYTTVGSLEMHDGSYFWAHPDSAGRASLVVVTNELTLGKVKIEFKQNWSATEKINASLPAYTVGDEVLVPLFKLTGAAAAKVPDLSGCELPDYPDKSGGVLPMAKELVCRTIADGVKMIYARYYVDYDWTMNTSKTSQKGWSECALNPGNSSYWIDGKMPSTDSKGIACATGAMEWRGQNTSDGFEFPDLTFVINKALYFYAAHANIGNLVLANANTVFTHLGSGVKHLQGKLTVLSSSISATIYNYVGCSLYIDAQIAGDGALQLRPDSNVNPSSFYHLTGDNSSFHGRLSSVAKFSNKNANNNWGEYPDPAKNWYTTIYLGGDHCLGGSYTGANAFSALMLGAWTKLKIEPTIAKVTLAEENRGILVTNECLQVETLEGQTLSVAQKLTYYGKLLKLGEGCLELAAEAYFGGNGQGVPEEGKNRLVVSNGTVKVSAVNAVNGLQVEVAEGARLVIDANCASQGMEQYGFVNTRWNTPFVSAYAGGELPMEVQGLQEGRARKVAICTVSSDVAAGLPLKVVRVPKFRHAVEKQENGDGTVTFVADFKPIGFAFVVR